MLGDGDGDGDGEIGLESESTIQLDEMLAAAAAAADADAEDSGRAYEDDDGHMARNGGVRIDIEDDGGVAGHRAHFERHRRHPFHHRTTQTQRHPQQQQHHFADIDGDAERGDDEQEWHASVRFQIDKSSLGSSHRNSNATGLDNGDHVALDIRKF
jgi:hypothetical protein